MLKKDVRVTIRLLPEKQEVYNDYKKVVTERLHSDVCYVTTMLMESFLNSINEMPNSDLPFELNFVKQNVQINMGCNFNYYTKKARRNAPNDPAEDVVTDTHNLLPNIVDQVPDLSEKARKFWFNELQAQGFISKDASPDAPPLVSTVVSQKKKKSFFGSIHSYCMTFVCWVLRRRVRKRK
jgi:hypothetical protein